MTLPQKLRYEPKTLPQKMGHEPVTPAPLQLGYEPVPVTLPYQIAVRIIELLSSTKDIPKAILVFRFLETQKSILILI